MHITTKNPSAANTGKHENLDKSIAYKLGTEKESGQVNLSLIEVKDNKVSSIGLHEFLGVKTRHDKWITKIISDYEFIEGKDFCPKMDGSKIGRPVVDYLLSVHTAKEICMVSKTQTAKQARKYFITCEEKITVSQDQEKIKSEAERFGEALLAGDVVTALALKQSYDNRMFSEIKKKQAELENKIDTVALQPRLEVKGYKHTRDTMRALKDEIGNSINALVNRYFGEYLGIPEFPAQHRRAWADYKTDTGKTYLGAKVATYEEKIEFQNWLKMLLLGSGQEMRMLETLNESWV